MICPISDMIFVAQAARASLNRRVSSFSWVYLFTQYYSLFPIIKVIRLLLKDSKGTVGCKKFITTTPKFLEEHFASFFLLQESDCFLFSLNYFVRMSYNVSELLCLGCLRVFHINLILLSSCPSGVHWSNLGQRLCNAFPHEHALGSWKGLVKTDS